MGGTSIEASLERRRPVQPFGEWNAGADREAPDTLLGPEGTGNRSFETDARSLLALGRFGRGLVRGWTAGRARQAPHPTRDPARSLRTAQWTRASSFMWPS